jgi:hypothetical protein
LRCHIAIQLRRGLADACGIDAELLLEEVAEARALKGCLAPTARWRVRQRDKAAAFVAELAKTGGDVHMGWHGAESGSHGVQVVVGDLHTVDVAEHP